MKKLLLSGMVTSAFVGCNGAKEQDNTAQNGEKRPNIILFVADDHGMDALGCYGNKVIKTPNLDALSQEGVRFNNAFCTSASSAASRAVILTGKFGHATGAYGHTHDYHHFSTYENVKSLPVRLAENGYYTARIGKYHLAPESVYHFETTFKANPRNTVEMAESCKETFNSDKPFFLYFCTDDPHRDAPINPDDWTESNSFGNRTEGYEGVETITYDPKDVVVPDFLPDTYITRKEIAQYYQSISRIDQGFGRMMQYLKQSGKADNTIVIYISDNGMAFPGAKTTLYEAGMKLPCIIKSPTIKEVGGWNNAMISWVDLTPTLLELAGVEYDKAAMHGSSFASVLAEPKSEARDKVYASHIFHEITMYYPMRVVHERQYKLIWNAAWQLPYPFASDLFIASTWQQIERDKTIKLGDKTADQFLHRTEFELYDLTKDPNEVNNLAYKPAFIKRRDQMIKDLKAWQVKTQDPWYILWDGDASLQGTGVNL